MLFNKCLNDRMLGCELMSISLSGRMIGQGLEESSDLASDIATQGGSRILWRGAALWKGQSLNRLLMHI